VYKINEVAEMLEVSPRTLRRWEKAGKIKVPTRDYNGHRIYSEELVEEIKSFRFQINKEV
jgi:DNA-binding transcriptional MerR regulator